MTLLPTVLMLLPLPSADTRPPNEDVFRFPPPAVVEQEREVNRLFREVALARADYVIVLETDRLYAVWDALHWTWRFGEDHRRDKLAELRSLLGPEAYYAGRMPPAVPLWRFQRLD